MPDSTAHSTRPGSHGPASTSEPAVSTSSSIAEAPSNGGLLRAILRRLRRREKNEAVREAIEELIEETPESDTPISEDQRVLLANILKLRDKTVADVMVPRVDISAIAADTPLDEVVRLIQAEAHSRYPIYRESLAAEHLADVLAHRLLDPLEPVRVRDPDGHDVRTQAAGRGDGGGLALAAALAVRGAAVLGPGACPCLRPARPTPWSNSVASRSRAARP